MLSPTSTSFCRLCGATLDPEATFRLEVGLFERSYEVCRPCRDDWSAGGRALLPFEPAFRGDRTYRWLGPVPEDARAILERIGNELGAPIAGSLASARKAIEGKPTEADLAAGLAAALAAGEELAPHATLERLVDRHAKTDLTPVLLGLHAHAAAGSTLSGVRIEKPSNAGRKALLEAARSAYLLYSSFTLRDGLDGRIAALAAHVSLELGDSAGAEEKLRAARRQMDAKAELRDARVPLYQALLSLRSGNLKAADDALAAGRAWGGSNAVLAVFDFDTYVRAVEGGRFEVAREALKAYCRLRPDDTRALYALAHVFMKCSLDPVAREVLASLHAREPRDEDALLLYATCLSRLGETRAAWQLLRDDLETDRDEEKLGAERRHLAGLCAQAEGHDDRALELLAEAWALASRDDRARANLVTLVLERVGDMIGSLTPESFPDLARFVATHGKALEAELGAVALTLFRVFLEREIAGGFEALPDFGPDLFPQLRFSNAHATLLQALSLLAQRKLGDAARKEREARAAGAVPAPLILLLAFLERVKAWDPVERRDVLGV
jgi:tetratricopeptide (TPR) repeat protein